MNIRKVDQYRVSTQTSDGAGVKLRRLFSRDDTLKLDPFLMLDTFDSRDPNDYNAGFPFHPHRGIQTFTYLISGEIEHKDSMGNKGTIRDGEYQWMSAGSGVFHEEMPKPSEHMLGFQLWINLPQTEKMSSPLYVDGNAENIPEIKKDDYTLHLLSGSFENTEMPYLPSKKPIEVYDIEIKPNVIVDISVNLDYSVFIYTMLGSAKVCDKFMENKAGATFIEGDCIKIETKDEPARIFLFSGEPLNEPIAWSGPIVMNTRQELIQAQIDLTNGDFVKENIKPV